MKWRRCEFREAMQFARPKTEAHGKDEFTEVYMPDAKDYAEAVWFTDGTAIACLSQWQRDYSPTTPGDGAESPAWWIYD